MAKKIFALLVMPALILSLGCSLVSAEELVNKELIEKRPVNVLDYTYAVADASWLILSRLAKTMDPVGFFPIGQKKKDLKKGGEKGLAGVELTLIEGFLHKKLYLTGGWTLRDNEPSLFFLGLEFELKLKGDLGEALSRVRPALVWCDDRFWLGASIELGKPHI